MPAALAGAVGAKGSPAPAPIGPTSNPVAAPANSAQSVTTGWGTPVFTDDFNGSSLDTSKWYVYNYPNAAKFPRTPAAISVSGGALNITGAYYNGVDMSGGISNVVNQGYGRWEVRFRVDRGSGYSAEALLWPSSENWPTDGEIDFAEVWDGNRQSATLAAHNHPSNLVVKGGAYADFSQWHTVAVDWLPDHITYYLDGAAVFTVPSSSGAVPTTSPMHLALQLDKGCVDGIPCRTSSTPAKVVMQVDWVKIYKRP